MRKDSIHRRELLIGLGAATLLAASGRPLRAQAGSTVQALGFNHLALNVTDLDRSQEYYQRHFGLTPVHAMANLRFMACGPHALALFASSTPGLNHFCFTAPRYEVDSVAGAMRQAGLELRIEGDRIYTHDPDGLEVQVAGADDWPADSKRRVG